MYAIIKKKGRQATVRTGDVIDVDLTEGAKAGDTVTFDEVLLIGDEGSVQVGRPTVAGASVTGEVIGDVKGKKLIAFRFKRRKNVRRKRGHRQQYTRIKITAINA